ncbi:MAG: A/G-specific adenine glycosylase [Pseudomonadota bacterium]
MKEEVDPAVEILAWYDRHHRDLPWRISPAARAAGERPDPYRVWLSEVMLQQTTVAAVTGYFLRFTERWPTVDALATAESEAVMAAWAGLGYYARARNLHRCAKTVAAERGGVFPDTEDGLRTLPGVGTYTAAAIAAIAFDRPATVVDGNVERVMARLYAEETPMPAAKPRLRRRAEELSPPWRPGDYAQAVMDLGATVCTPRKPACAICPWRPRCRASWTGIAEMLPRKVPKAAKPVRRGFAYLAIDPAGAVMTVRRPETGLLGGMLALPSGVWTEATAVTPTPPCSADWQEAGEVRHTFTHFHLRLTVLWAPVARIETGARTGADAAAAMPTVFAKACRLGLSAAAKARPPSSGAGRDHAAPPTA